MNLVFLSNGFPPRHTAGTENYTAGIASALAQAGHRVSVICVGEWDSGPQPVNGVTRDTYQGVAVARLDANWTAGPDPNRYLYDNPVIADRVAALLDEMQPDLVHITSCATLSASVIRVVKQRGLPLVITLTDYWFICPRISLLHADGHVCDGQTSAWECLTCLLWGAKAYRLPARVLPAPVLRPLLQGVSRQPWLSRRPGLRGMALDMADRKARLLPLLAQADRLISPSRFLAAMHTACGVTQPIHVLEHGHDLGWADQVGPRPVNRPRLVIGYVGQIGEIKGVHILLAAIARLDPQQEAVEVQIWGDPDKSPAYSARLRAQAAALPHVQFCGRFSRQQLAAVYGGFDVLVVPSLWVENNPLVIQEAFAAGVPVIASNQGGMAEFVTHEQNGLLFTPGDADSLAAALRRLLLEPDLLPRLRRQAPAVKTVQAELAELLHIYHELHSPG